MKLILVRHGETFANLNNISQGHLDSKLTQKGINQTKKVAQRLKNEKIDIAYSSDLSRLLDTCTEILKFHPKTKLIISQELREQNKGIWEGKDRKDRDEAMKKEGFTWYNWKPENGESLMEMGENVILFLKKEILKNKNKTVLIVSRGGPISILLAYLHKDNLKNYRDYLPRINTAVTEIEFKNNKSTFHTLNCTNHLNLKDISTLKSA